MTLDEAPAGVSPAARAAAGGGGGNGSDRASATRVLSPSHPTNLRKQVKPRLDPSFSLKSYVGAAATLFEKAQTADAQGNLESAFINYLMTARYVDRRAAAKHP